MMWWRKGDSKPESEKIMISETEVASFNDFRTIPGPDSSPKSDQKQKGSLLWENTRARDIERRLGVHDD